MLRELKGRFHQRADRTGEKSGELVEALQFLAIAFCQLWFVVPSVDVTRTAVDEQPDHRFGFGLKVWCAGCQRIERADFGGVQHAFAGQQ